jgi:hypothetical protein
MRLDALWSGELQDEKLSDAVVTFAHGGRVVEAPNFSLDHWTALSVEG